MTAILPSPSYRTVISNDAWLTAKYNYTLLYMSENGTLNISNDQRLFNTDSGYLKVSIMLSNIGLIPAKNVKLNIELGEGTTLNSSMIEDGTQFSENGQSYTITAKSHIYVDEPYVLLIYLLYTSIARRKLTNSNREFIKSMSISMDGGNSQIAQSISNIASPVYQAGVRESVNLYGNVSGTNITNLTMTLTAELTALNNPSSKLVYTFKKKVLFVNCSDNSSCDALSAMKFWTTIAENITSNTLVDSVYPKDFVASYLYMTNVSYMVECKEDNGNQIAINSWEYDIIVTDALSIPLWAIILIPIVAISVISVVIGLLIRRRMINKRKLREHALRLEYLEKQEKSSREDMLKHQVTIAETIKDPMDIADVDGVTGNMVWQYYSSIVRECNSPETASNNSSKIHPQKRNTQEECSPTMLCPRVYDYEFDGVC